LQTRIGKLETAVGCKAPTKLLRLANNPLLDFNNASSAKNKNKGGGTAKFVNDELDRFAREKLNKNKQDNGSWASDDDEPVAENYNESQNSGINKSSKLR
jgi:hypothetical protein